MISLDFFVYSFILTGLRWAAIYKVGRRTHRPEFRKCPSVDRVFGMKINAKVPSLDHTSSQNKTASSIFGFQLGKPAANIKRKVGTQKKKTGPKFKQADVTKAVRGTQQAGLTVREVQISFDGKIAILTGEGKTALNSLDQWRASRASKA